MLKGTFDPKIIRIAYSAPGQPKNTCRERNFMSTGYVWLERYGWHDTGTAAGFVPSGPAVQPYQHFESAESKVRLASLIEVSGLGEQLYRIAVTPATEADVLRVHDREYVQRIQELSKSAHGGDTGDLRR